ncbi:MAG: anion permease [Negativicutes bacterium]
MSKTMRALFVLAVGAIIWFLPVPAGLKPQAWHLFSIFVATILGFILQPLPIGTIAFTGVTISALTNTLKPAEALSGFSDGTVWLVISAFLIAKGFIKSQLGRRIAYVIMRKIGDSTLKLGYTLVFSDLIIAPATPSNTARAGGILYPIAKSLAVAFESEPGPTANRVGSYLMSTTFQGNAITSAMFMTSCAPNPLMVALAASVLKLDISWGLWALAALVPGVISLLATPYIMYKINPPELKKTPEAKIIAEKELEKMGPMSAAEKIMLMVFAGLLLLWATSQITNLNATVVAMLGVVVLLSTRVLEWEDVITEKGAWDTMIWLGGITGLASYLNKTGFIPWFAKSVSVMLDGVAWVPALGLLVIIYVYSHYGFASLTAHVSAMYAVFAAVAVTTGAPPYLAALSLAFASNLMAGLTHYSTGHAPIFFGAGYVSQGKWWTYGFIMSVINLIIWVGIGSIWWKVIGLW